MAYKLIVDQDPTFAHVFEGTGGNDRMISNGLAEFIFAFGGDDDVNPGINTSGERWFLYNWSLPGFGVDPEFVGTRAQLDNDGDDFFHIGRDVTAKPGSGADTVQVHGPSPAGEHAAEAWLDFFEGDTLILDHTAGWKINKTIPASVTLNADGSKTMIVKSMELVGLSVKPGFDQAVNIVFSDDRRGEFHALEIDYVGTARHEVADYVRGLFDDGSIL